MSFEWSLPLALATAHLLADFVFQSDSDVANKKRIAVQLKHVAIVSGLSYLLAGDWRAWPLPALIGLTHYLIDRLKVKANRNGLGVFVADQAAHLLVLVGITWLSLKFYPVQSVWAGLWGMDFAKALELLAGIILTVNVGGVVVGISVKPYLDDLTKPKEERGILVAAGQTKAQSNRGLLKGGKVIGQLERALIFFLVGIGKPEAVAFLVAAKSIFRFGDLVDRKRHAEAEYITIGTLMSFTWGLMSAWLTWWLYGKI